MHTDDEVAPFMPIYLLLFLLHSNYMESVIAHCANFNEFIVCVLSCSFNLLELNEQNDKRAIIAVFPASTFGANGSFLVRMLIIVKITSKNHQTAAAIIGEWGKLFQ